MKNSGFPAGFLTFLKWFNVIVAGLCIGLRCFLPGDQGLCLALCGAVGLALALWCRQTREGLVAGRYWAWVSAIVIFGINAFSLFFPFSLAALISVARQRPGT